MNQQKVAVNQQKVAFKIFNFLGYSETLIQKFIYLQKIFCERHGTQEIAQTVICPWVTIILSIGHFEGPTEFQLSSWWRAVSLWSITVWLWRLILLKEQWNFLQCLIWTFIHFEKIFCERVLSWYTWYSRNCSVEWTVDEKLLASDQSQFDNTD